MNSSPGGSARATRRRESACWHRCTTVGRQRATRGRRVRESAGGPRERLGRGGTPAHPSGVAGAGPGRHRGRRRARTGIVDRTVRAGRRRRARGAGRRELRQRLLRRRPRRRHRAARRPSPRGRERPGHAARRCCIAIGLAMAVAAAAGLALAAMVSWWLVLIGFGAFVALLGYSGGPRPYASAGLGEVFVFVFFGLIAHPRLVLRPAPQLPATAWVAAVATGVLAVAILVVNNLRDVPTDADRRQADPRGPARRGPHPPAVRRRDRARRRCSPSSASRSRPDRAGRCWRARRCRSPASRSTRSAAAASAGR